MRKILILLFSLFLIQGGTALGAEKSCFEIPVDAFTARLALAGARTNYALGRKTIKNRYVEKAEDRIVITSDSSVMLIIYCDDELKKIKDLAVAYFTMDSEDLSGGRKGEKKQDIPNEILFRKICKQLLYALNTGMAESEAEKLLNQLGIQSEYIDCVQREIKTGKYTYMMKLSREGVLVMTVSHI